MSDGFLSSEKDLMQYVDHCNDLLTHQKARRWVDPDQMETFEEQQEDIRRLLSDLIRIYRSDDSKMPSRGEAALPLKTMRQLAISSQDEDLAWWAWRTDAVPAENADKKPIGYGGDALTSSQLLPASAIIKHVYNKIPKPIRLTLTKVEQDGRKVYTGSTSAAKLDAICKVPHMDPNLDSHEFGMQLYNGEMNKDKWQRVVDVRRVMSISSFISEPSTYIFNPVLIYISRNQESGCYKEIKKLNGHGEIEINFDFLKMRNLAWTDYVPLPGDGDTRPATIIDGQHRIRGLVMNERGAGLELPFVIIIGDGGKDDQKLIAEIFTQINTKSVPIDSLHKMYLSYKFGMESKTATDNWAVSEDGWESQPPKPTQESRPNRRAYELGLYMSHAHKSPLYDMIEFQRPATSKGRKKAHICINVQNWVSYARKWFVSGGVYSESAKDKYCQDELFNFFKAFETTCNSQWEMNQPRWKVGAGRNKPLLQYEGPFLSLLTLYPRIIQYMRDDLDINVPEGEPISQEIFVDFLKPLSSIDWMSSQLHRSDLKGRTNTNIRHLVTWMYHSLVNGEVYSKKDVIDPNIKSIIGKGLLAPPAQTDITRISGPSWPDAVSPLQLRFQYLSHTLSDGWIVILNRPGGPEEIDTKGLVQKAIGVDGNYESHLSIDGDIVPLDTESIEVQAWLSNGNGKTLSKRETFTSPGLDN